MSPSHIFYFSILISFRQIHEFFYFWFLLVIILIFWILRKLILLQFLFSLRVKLFSEWIHHLLVILKRNSFSSLKIFVIWISIERYILIDKFGEFFLRFVSELPLERKFLFIISLAFRVLILLFKLLISFFVWFFIFNHIIFCFHICFLCLWTYCFLSWKILFF